MSYKFGTSLTEYTREKKKKNKEEMTLRVKRYFDISM